jgi:hypothetical protein
MRDHVHLDRSAKGRRSKRRGGWEGNELVGPACPVTGEPVDSGRADQL